MCVCIRPRCLVFDPLALNPFSAFVLFFSFRRSVRRCSQVLCRGQRKLGSAGVSVSTPSPAVSSGLYSRLCPRVCGSTCAVCASNRHRRRAPALCRLHRPALRPLSPSPLSPATSATAATRSSYPPVGPSGPPALTSASSVTHTPPRSAFLLLLFLFFGPTRAYERHHLRWNEGTHGRTVLRRRVLFQRLCPLRSTPLALTQTRTASRTFTPALCFSVFSLVCGLRAVDLRVSACPRAFILFACLRLCKGCAHVDLFLLGLVDAFCGVFAGVCEHRLARECSTRVASPTLILTFPIYSSTSVVFLSLSPHRRAAPPIPLSPRPLSTPHLLALSLSSDRDPNCRALSRVSLLLPHRGCRLSLSSSVCSHVDARSRLCTSLAVFIH